MTRSKLYSILLVEDSASMAHIYKEYLKFEPVDLHHVERGQQALSFLAEQVPDIVILDLMLPDMNGMDILRHITENKIPTATVIITAHGSVGNAVEAMNLGALDFLEKPFDRDRFVVTLGNVFERSRLGAIVDSIQDMHRTGYGGFIGSSLAMQSVYQIIDHAAPSKASVFITGESGTGKEVCAEAIHSRSPRGKRPFIAINCAAIPKDLMESEIFGHVKGAFTGAVAARDGAASRADGGTLLLDEITEMDIDLQAKLLRFVQTGTFQKVGGEKSEKVDLRFVCTTNRDPLGEVDAGRLREDLYYRLHVIPIVLPPLREREDDVVEIAVKFLTAFAREEGKQFSRLSEDTLEIFRAYSWPGNVRELQNVIRNVVVLFNGDEVTPEMLPAPLNKTAESASPGLSMISNRRIDTRLGAEDSDVRANQDGDIRPLWRVEKDAIQHAISICDGNVPKAAALLGVSPSTIYRKRQAWKDQPAG